MSRWIVPLLFILPAADFLGDAVAAGNAEHKRRSGAVCRMLFVPISTTGRKRLKECANFGSYLRRSSIALDRSSCLAHHETAKSKLGGKRSASEPYLESFSRLTRL